MRFEWKWKMIPRKLFIFSGPHTGIALMHCAPHIPHTTHIYAPHSPHTTHIHSSHTFAGNLHQTHLLLRIHLPMHPQEWGFGSEAKQCFRAEFSNTRAQEPCTLRVFGCRQISADTRAHFKCFANSCQHICPDICTDWPTTGHLVVSWSCLKITLSQVFRALPWSNWVSTSINWGLLLGWPAWAGWEPWRTLVFDQGWRWCFSIQPWSRPQSMATPSTIFNGDLGPPPNWILSRVAWRQLKCVRWQHRIGHSTFGELPQPMLTLGHVECPNVSINQIQWRPPSYWILSRVAWKQLKCFQWQYRTGHSTSGGTP